MALTEAEERRPAWQAGNSLSMKKNYNETTPPD